MFKQIKFFVALAVSFCFLFEQTGFAQAVSQPHMPPGYVDFTVKDKFRPLHLRSLSIDPKSNDYNILMDKGDAKKLSKEQMKEAAQNLMKYFQIGLALPDETFWVNLRPDAQDNIIDPLLEKTDLGKVLLEADLQLKKDVARFTDPATPLGRQYWEKIYTRAEALFGVDEMTIPTLTRPWIVPGEVIVREGADNAYIYKATLKVMLEQDYIKDSQFYNFSDPRLKALNEYSSELIRRMIIPCLTKEVNSSKRYAGLRQVYYSLVLSQWFKKKYNNAAGGSPQNAFISRINSKDLSDLSSSANWSKSSYYQDYRKSFEQGEYAKEETVYTSSGPVIRQYVSGGVNLGAAVLPALPGVVVGTNRFNEALNSLSQNVAIEQRGGGQSVVSGEAVNTEQREQASEKSLLRKSLELILPALANDNPEQSAARKWLPTVMTYIVYGGLAVSGAWLAVAVSLGATIGLRFILGTLGFDVNSRGMNAVSIGALIGVKLLLGDHSAIFDIVARILAVTGLYYAGYRLIDSENKALRLVGYAIVGITTFSIIDGVVAAANPGSSENVNIENNVGTASDGSTGQDTQETLTAEQTGQTVQTEQVGQAGQTPGDVDGTSTVQTSATTETESNVSTGTSDSQSHPGSSADVVSGTTSETPDITHAPTVTDNDGSVDLTLSDAPKGDFWVVVTTEDGVMHYIPADQADVQNGVINVDLSDYSGKVDLSIAYPEQGDISDSSVTVEILSSTPGDGAATDQTGSSTAAATGTTVTSHSGASGTVTHNTVLETGKPGPGIDNNPTVTMKTDVSAGAWAIAASAVAGAVTGAAAKLIPARFKESKSVRWAVTAAAVIGVPLLAIGLGTINPILGIAFFAAAVGAVLVLSITNRNKAKQEKEKKTEDLRTEARKTAEEIKQLHKDLKELREKSESSKKEIGQLENKIKGLEEKKLQVGMKLQQYVYESALMEDITNSNITKVAEGDVVLVNGKLKLVIESPKTQVSTGVDAFFKLSAAAVDMETGKVEQLEIGLSKDAAGKYKKVRGGLKDYELRTDTTNLENGDFIEVDEQFFKVEEFEMTPDGKVIIKKLSGRPGELALESAVSEARVIKGEVTGYMGMSKEDGISEIFFTRMIPAAVEKTFEEINPGDVVELPDGETAIVKEKFTKIDGQNLIKFEGAEKFEEVETDQFRVLVDQRLEEGSVFHDISKGGWSWRVVINKNEGKIDLLDLETGEVEKDVPLSALQRYRAVPGFTVEEGGQFIKGVEAIRAESAGLEQEIKDLREDLKEKREDDSLANTIQETEKKLKEAGQKLADMVKKSKADSSAVKASEAEVGDYIKIVLESKGNGDVWGLVVDKVKDNLVIVDSNGQTQNISFIYTVDIYKLDNLAPAEAPADEKEKEVQKAIDGISARLDELRSYSQEVKVGDLKKGDIVTFETGRSALIVTITPAPAGEHKVEYVLLENGMKTVERNMKSSQDVQRFAVKKSILSFNRKPWVKLQNQAREQAGIIKEGKDAQKVAQAEKEMAEKLRQVSEYGIFETPEGKGTEAKDGDIVSVDGEMGVVVVDNDTKLAITTDAEGASHKKGITAKTEIRKLTVDSASAANLQAFRELQALEGQKSSLDKQQEEIQKQKEQEETEEQNGTETKKEEAAMGKAEKAKRTVRLGNVRRTIAAEIKKIKNERNLDTKNAATAIANIHSAFSSVKDIVTVSDTLVEYKDLKDGQFVRANREKAKDESAIEGVVLKFGSNVRLIKSDGTPEVVDTNYSFNELTEGISQSDVQKDRQVEESETEEKSETKEKPETDEKPGIGESLKRQYENWRNRKESAKIKESLRKDAETIGAEENLATPAAKSSRDSMTAQLKSIEEGLVVNDSAVNSIEQLEPGQVVEMTRQGEGSVIGGIVKMGEGVYVVTIDGQAKPVVQGDTIKLVEIEASNSGKSEITDDSVKKEETEKKEPEPRIKKPTNKEEKEDKKPEIVSKSEADSVKTGGWMSRHPIVSSTIFGLITSHAVVAMGIGLFAPAVVLSAAIIIGLATLYVSYRIINGRSAAKDADASSGDNAKKGSFSSRWRIAAVAVPVLFGIAAFAAVGMISHVLALSAIAGVVAAVGGLALVAGIYTGWKVLSWTKKQVWRIGGSLKSWVLGRADKSVTDKKSKENVEKKEPNKDDSGSVEREGFFARHSKLGKLVVGGSGFAVFGLAALFGLNPIISIIAGAVAGVWVNKKINGKSDAKAFLSSKYGIGAIIAGLAATLIAGSSLGIGVFILSVAVAYMLYSRFGKTEDASSEKSETKTPETGTKETQEEVNSVKIIPKPPESKKQADDTEGGFNIPDQLADMLNSGDKAQVFAVVKQLKALEYDSVRAVLQKRDININALKNNLDELLVDGYIDDSQIKQVLDAVQKPVGGIDFRALPIVSQPAMGAMPPIDARAWQIALQQSKALDTDKEWRQIQAALKKGQVPDCAKLKQYVIACSGQEDADKEMEKVLACVAQILRIEEDEVLPTGEDLRELLVILDSDKPAATVKAILQQAQAQTEQAVAVS